jgi:hypothetical protein
MPEQTPNPLLPEPGPEALPPSQPELPSEPAAPEVDHRDDDLIPGHNIDDAGSDEA